MSLILSRTSPESKPRLLLQLQKIYLFLVEYRPIDRQSNNTQVKKQVLDTSGYIECVFITQYTPRSKFKVKNLKTNQSTCFTLNRDHQWCLIQTMMIAIAGDTDFKGLIFNFQLIQV